MRIPIVATALAGLALASGQNAAVPDDVLARQAAVVREGKTSIPTLLAGYREQIQREPRNPLAYTLAAAVYDRDESRVLFDKAIALAPDFGPARVGLGRYLLRSERFAAAFTELNQASALRPADAAVRTAAINAAVRAGRMADAKRLAGTSPAFALEIVHTLIDAGQYDAANQAITDAGLSTLTDGPVLLAKGRRMHMASPKTDAAKVQAALDVWMDAWRKSPELLLHYRFEYPRRTLVQALTDARRTGDLRAVVIKGLAIYPDEYPLYESLWKLEFAAAKSDYTAERKTVVAAVLSLLKSRQPSADLLKTAALGYKMATANDDADRVNRRLVAEFPFAMASQMVRRGEASEEKDLRRKLALLDAFNRDFVTIPMYTDSFSTLDELNVPDAELLKGAETLIREIPYPHAVLQVAEVFLKRGIYYDRLAAWLDRYQGAGPIARDAWEARIRAFKGKLLLVQGRANEAEPLLRPLPDQTLQGYSNVDKGKAQFYLAEVLEAKKQLPDAVEMYAQAYAQSQHYLADAGAAFTRLYRQTHGGDAGRDAYLAMREGMYQVAAITGIERGTKLNTPAPAFSMLSLKGDRVTLASVKGKVAIVNFWATWCGPCLAELPHFQEFADQMKSDPGVVVLAVTTDENRALVEPFIKQKGYTFTVLYDEGLKGALEIRGIPATFVIDADGVLRLRMIGFNQNEPLVPYLSKLVEEVRPKRAQTPAAPPAAVPASEAKTAFQGVDRIPRRALSDAEWRAAKKNAAVEALSDLPAQVTGPDLYYMAKLEALAEQWTQAVTYFKAYLALPPDTDHDGTMNRLMAPSDLRDTFIKGGLAADGEKYYASDPIALALFVSQRGDEARTLGIYEAYLAQNPPAERARLAKSLLVITLGSLRRPDEMARRLDQYRADLTPNAIVNDLSTIARLYTEAGTQAQAERYTRELFEFGKQSKDGKAVDGPINAHINWMIKRFEGANDPGGLNNFLLRVRTEFAANASVIGNLDSREVFRKTLDQPAQELEVAHAVNRAAGAPVDLRSLRGRVVLLDFFAHWCGPCIADFPIVRDLQKRFEPQGLTVLGLSGIYGYYQGQKPLTPDEEVQRMKDHFAKEYQVTWPMLFSGTKANNDHYGVTYIPHLVLIDRKGVVRFAKVGSSDERELEQQILKLLAEKPGTGPAVR